MNRNIVYLLAAGIGALVVWNLIPGDTDTDGDGEPMISVIVPELTQGAMAGKALFDENCASCHGNNIAGIKGTGPTLIHKVYEPNHHGDGAFFSAAINGVRQHHWPFGNMPPVEGIKKEEVAKIIVYVRELQKANKIF